MHEYVHGVKSQVARKYQHVVHESYNRYFGRNLNANRAGFGYCQGWHDRLCPLDKLVRPGRVRCLDCWRQLRDAKKAETAAKKAVADVWAKFEQPPTCWPNWHQKDSSDDEEEAEQEAEETAETEETDPLAAHKLATLLGARGESGFQMLGKDKRQGLDKMDVTTILYETISRLAYIADPNVITREDRTAASRCGGLPVLPPYLLPRVGMPHVADTEDDLYLTFLVKLQDMTCPNGIEDADNAIFPMTFFCTSNVKKVICCKAALAAACVAHKIEQGIDCRSVTPELFEGGVWAPGNISTSQ